MFIWDFAANPVMESILDWFYSQMVGFLGASSIERIPVERPLMEAVKDFKAQKLGKK